jgi:hypothetical protein
MYRRFLLCTLIVGLIVLIAAGRVKNGSDSVAQQTVDKSVKKSGLELFADNDDAELGIVDFQPLSSDRVLVSVSDTLFLLNAKKEVVWQTYIDMVAPPIVDSTGAIFGIRSDLGHFSVNAKTGKVTAFGRDIAGTHAYYTQIKPYKGDQYLVVENMQFYRDGNLCYPKCPMSNDRLYAWMSQKMLWSTDFPPNAELHVWGEKIFALTKQKGSVIVQEVEVPK